MEEGKPVVIDLAKIAELAEELIITQAEVDKLEGLLDDAQRRVRDLAERRLPELMDAANMEEFKTREGFRIKIQDNVFASIKVENREAAFEWLEANGHGGMVKRAVMVAFNREQGEAAKDLKTELAKKFPGVKTEMEVHPSTLRAWVRKRLEAGEEIPDSITTENIRAAKIDRPKK